MRGEALQIGAGGVNGAVIHLVGQSRVTVQVERPPIPVGIPEDYVFEIIGPRAKWLRTAGDGPPSQLAARFEPRREPFSRAWIQRRRVNLPDRFHLGVRQALLATAFFAFERSRIETAAGGSPMSPSFSPSRASQAAMAAW